VDPALRQEQTLPRQTLTRRWIESWWRPRQPGLEHPQTGQEGWGVEVLTPEDVIMSEAERHQVCKQIGDEPGARAKRRREIEKMDEVEIG
jgi:hypothetical protein